MGQKHGKLMHAIESGDVDNVRQTMEKKGRSSKNPSGIDVNFQTKKNGLTSLHCVCAKYSENQYETIKLLLRMGANPNVRDKYGATPLHYAAYQGRDGAVKLLLDNSGNPNVLNNDGKSPKQYALNRSHFFCYEVLETAERNIAVHKSVRAEEMEAVQAEVIVLNDAEEWCCTAAAQRADESEREEAEATQLKKQKRRERRIKELQEEQKREEIVKVESKLRRRRGTYLVSDKSATLNFKIKNRTTGISTYLLLAVSPDLTLESLYSKMAGLTVKKFPKEEHLGIKEGTRTMFLRIMDPSLKREYFLVPRERFDQFTTVDIIDNLPQEAQNPVHVEFFSDTNIVDNDEYSLFDPSFSVVTEKTRSTSFFNIRPLLGDTTAAH